MTRTEIKFGKVDAYGNGRKQCEVVLEIELRGDADKPTLSVCGEVWNARHTDIIMGGQCIDDIWNEYQDQIQNKELYKEIMELWENYHLNDSNAWCEHQNYGKGLKEVVIHHMYGNEEWERINAIRELPPKHLEVTDAGMKNVPSKLYDFSKSNIYPASDTVYSGHVRYDATYRPDGMLGVECPVCGAKYGHSWYYKPIPENDLNRIKEIMGV